MSINTDTRDELLDAATRLANSLPKGYKLIGVITMSLSGYNYINNSGLPLMAAIYSLSEIIRQIAQTQLEQSSEVQRNVSVN